MKTDSSSDRGVASEAALTPAPVRACRFTLDMQADNRQELIDALSNMADQLARGELTKGVSGGPYSGWTYEFIENEHPTHDEYFAEVRAYLDAKKTPPGTVQTPAAPIK